MTDDRQPEQPEDEQPEAPAQPEQPEQAEQQPDSDSPRIADLPPGWSRLSALLRRAMAFRISRGRALAAFLVACLGFALVAQISQRGEQRLTGLRQSELVQILDNIGDRRDRLAAEQSDLEAERRELASGASGSQAAIRAAQDRLEVLGILAGTIGAEGTGVQVFISDPQHDVRAAQILDLVQELRDAGAEAIQIGNSRVVASTSFTDVDGAIAIDGRRQGPPYTILAIGDGQTMATALQIPGGVIASLPSGARGSVAVEENVKITALRPVPAPRYAQPATTATPGG